MRQFTARFLVGMTVCVLTAAGAQAQSKGALVDQRVGPPVPAVERGGGTIYCSSNLIQIPDNDPNGTVDPLGVADSYLIGDLNVSVNATHTWVGDLIFTLEHQDTGTTVTFIDRPGVPAGTFGCSGDDIDAEIDDEAVLPVEDECGAGVPTILGSFIGGDPANSGLMAAFDGEDITGTWNLTVSDNAGGDTGTVNGWCLIVEMIPVELMSISVE